MKKEFEAPLCDVIEFDEEDVITTSGGPITPIEPTA